MPAVFELVSRIHYEMIYFLKIFNGISDDRQYKSIATNYFINLSIDNNNIDASHVISCHQRLW